VIGGAMSLKRVIEISESGHGYLVSRQKSDTIEQRKDSSVCAVGLWLVVTGGAWTKNLTQMIPNALLHGEKTFCERYNMETDKWQTIPALNQDRYSHASCAFANRFVYVFAGQGFNGQNHVRLNSIEMWDSRLLSDWLLIEVNEDVFSARVRCGATQFNNEMIVFGGQNANASFIHQVCYFSPHTHTFRQNFDNF
jgi:hypothetical protein